ncbi:hypothetical protein [Hymenobacter seoulensis]
MTFFVVMLYHGVSAGVASYVPLLALAGATLLFVVAAPLLVYHPTVGLYSGLAGCLLQVPFSMRFLALVVNDVVHGAAPWALLVGILPVTLVLLSSYWTGKALLRPSSPRLTWPAVPAINVLLCVLPLLLAGSYVYAIRASLSWSMFTPGL